METIQHKLCQKGRLPPPAPFYQFLRQKPAEICRPKGCKILDRSVTISLFLSMRSATAGWGVIRDKHGGRDQDRVGGEEYLPDTNKGTSARRKSAGSRLRHLLAQRDMKQGND